MSSMSGFFSWGNPSADDQTPEAARFRNDYQSLYDINYRTTGGNADAAKKNDQPADRPHMEYQRG